MNERNNGSGGAVRLQLAQTAARLMAEEGISSFQSAKFKAAERLGVLGNAQLPSNQEIDVCLQEYLATFHGEEHTSRLRRLRRVAVAAMRYLEPFDPRLVGPVLHGTAGEYSVVSLHVFCDAHEELAWHLDEAGIPYRLEERNVRLTTKLSAACPTYSFIADGTPVELIAFPIKHLRQAPLSPVDGRPMARADRVRVEALLADDPVSE